MPSSQRSRDFLLPQGQPASKHVLLFSDLLAHHGEKAYSTKQRYYCNSLSCLPQVIDNSATKGSFFDRQLSYSCLSHSSSVLAANDCRVVLIFLQRSPSFLLASQAGSNTITSPGIPANVRTSQTSITWTRTRLELVRGLMCSGKKKPVPQRCSSLIFSIFLHQISCRRVQSIFETIPTKSEACLTMPCISLVLISRVCL